MEAPWLVIALLALFGVPKEANSLHMASLMVQPEDRIPNEYIVMLQPNLTPLSSRVEAFKQYTSRHRLTGVDILGQVQMREFAALHVRAADDAVLELLRKYADVDIIAANSEVRINKQTWSSEVDTGQCVRQEPATSPWGLTRTSYKDKPDYSSATYSYNEQSGSGVTAYVIDTGIYTEHNDFEGRAVWGYTASGLRDEGNVDLQGHGTHVAGTIGGATFGIAKKARLVAVKVLNAQGVGSTFEVTEGIAWACNDFFTNRDRDRRYKGVINMSLGGSPNVIQERQIQECIDRGMPFVVSAGNEAGDTCSSSPARVSSAITVGATDQSDSLASFSNWGPCVNILAPGVNTLSAGITGPDSTAVKQGTSMSSPHVTGVVARFLSGLDEQPSSAQVKARLVDMAQVNKIDMKGDDNLLSTPNLLLYIPCAEDGWEINITLIITAVTLAVVCIAAIVAVARCCKSPKSGYQQV